MPLAFGPHRPERRYHPSTQLLFWQSPSLPHLPPTASLAAHVNPEHRALLHCLSCAHLVPSVSPLPQIPPSRVWPTSLRPPYDTHGETAQSLSSLHLPPAATFAWHLPPAQRPDVHCSSAAHSLSTERSFPHTPPRNVAFPRCAQQCAVTQSASSLQPPTPSASLALHVPRSQRVPAGHDADFTHKCPSCLPSHLPNHPGSTQLFAAQSESEPQSSCLPALGLHTWPRPWRAQRPDAHWRSSAHFAAFSRLPSQMPPKRPIPPTRSQHFLPPSQSSWELHGCPRGALPLHVPRSHRPLAHALLLTHGVFSGLRPQRPK